MEREARCNERSLAELTHNIASTSSRFYEISAGLASRCSGLLLAALGCSWLLWAAPGLLLGCSWQLLWAALGCSSAALGCSGLLWAALGCSWAAPGLLLSCSGLLLAAPGCSWAALGCSGLLKASLGCSCAAPGLRSAMDPQCKERKKQRKKVHIKIYYIHRAPGRRAKPRLAYNSHRVGKPTSASRHHGAALSAKKERSKERTVI